MIYKYQSYVEVAEYFARYFVRSANAIIQEGFEFHIALSGGNTPTAFFMTLEKNYKDAVDWSKVHFFWGDERMVPESSSESNYGTAKKLFFDKVDIPKANIHPIHGESDPEKEAKRYGSEVEAFLPSENGIPRFDMVILGMGADGHTASIFPNQIELIHSPAIYDVAIHPVTGQERLSITGRVINNARRVVFLVTGEGKAGKVNEIFNHTGDFIDFPAAHVSPETGKLHWFLDELAGSNVEA